MPPERYSDASDPDGLPAVIDRLDSAKIQCHLTGREYACIQYSKRLCDLKQKCYGPLSEEYLLELLDLSNYYSERLMYGKSHRIHNMAYKPYMQKLRDDFNGMDLEQRQLYWKDAAEYVRKTLDIAYNSAAPGRIDDASLMAESAYNATLLYKGILLSLSRDADVKDIPQLRIVWQDVRSALGREDLAIEFFRTDSGEYGAILLKKDWKKPKLIRLPVPKKVSADRIFSDASAGMCSGGPDIGASLRQASDIIWSDRLLQYFPRDGKGTVYFSADGMLLQTGIEYLPFAEGDGDGRYHSMSDAFTLARLSSTRELVYGHGQAKMDSAVVYGGIYYNIPAGLNTSAPNQTRGAVNTLPATMKEAVEIGKSLSDRGVEVCLRTGARADEHSFTAMDGGSYSIIHIATHGFYWTARQKPDVENPLARCGLLMAGSMNQSVAPDPGMDGLLTAEEISHVSILDNDLVVLSACETAMGDMSSDGVFGLQRGFKMAGAGTIIMSLWKVKDDATKDLMTSFYSSWLQPGCTKREAFGKAVDAVRSKYSDPSCWAAFVMLD